MTKRESDGYEVRFTNGIEVAFDKTGKYREVDGNGTPIPTDVIDANIVDYVTAKYPSKEITGIERKSNAIDVDLTDGVDLKFDGKGKFRKRD